MLTMFPACHTAPHLYSDRCKVKWGKFSINNAKEDILPLFTDFIHDVTTFRLVNTFFFCFRIKCMKCTHSLFFNLILKKRWLHVINMNVMKCNVMKYGNQ